MNKEVNPRNIVLAREARGLTQKDLAAKIEITQSQISKIEQGLQNASDEIVQVISNELGFPLSFFYDKPKEIVFPVIYYRKRSSLPKKYSDQIDAVLNIKSRQILKLLTSVDINRTFKPMDVDEYGNPEQIARLLRQQWRIPQGPINNLVKYVEDAGIIVLTNSVNHPKFDGMAFYIDSGQPIIYLNKEISGDRFRFSLAHELGHLIMHSYFELKSDRDPEKEADRFASEFLMPEMDIKRQFPIGNLNIPLLSDLKRYWKVSMAALIRRAKSLDRITDSQYKYLCMQMSSAGYRRKEPIDIAFEDPMLLKQLIHAHVDQLDYSIPELSEILGIRVSELTEEYFEPQKVFKLSI